jgi:hypothetical protein
LAITYATRIALVAFFEKAVGRGDGRSRSPRAKALFVVTRNICVHHEPLYALGDWAARREGAGLGLSDIDVSYLDDDRVGRALGRLFDADQARVLNELVLRAVVEFDVDCSRLHNDSTSVELSGLYTSATGQRRGGKKTTAVAYGFSNEHRPDLEQLVRILTVAADEAVPLAHRICDASTEDSTTHIAIWDAPCELLRAHGLPLRRRCQDGGPHDHGAHRPPRRALCDRAAAMAQGGRGHGRRVGCPGTLVAGGVAGPRWQRGRPLRHRQGQVHTLL